MKLLELSFMEDIKKLRLVRCEQSTICIVDNNLCHFDDVKNFEHLLNCSLIEM